MDVMMIFDVVMMGIGVYMMLAAWNMRRKNEIGTVILAEEELANCKDKAGFITYMHWREAVMGGALILYGAIGLLDKYILKIGSVINYVSVAGLLIIFAWFYKSMQSARERYL